MRAGDWREAGQQLLVLILHDNLDFVRDLSKGLRSKGISCQPLCQVDFDKLPECPGQRIMVVVDIDVIERNLRVLRRLLRSKSVEEQVFFVNAKRYEKGDWTKIKTYCEMIYVKDRLWRAAEPN